MTRDEPLKFRIGIADFESGLLPEGSREPGSEAFNNAVVVFYRNQFAPLGGEVDVQVDDDTIEVSWDGGREDASLIERALSLLQRGDLVQAVPLLQALIAVEPRNVDALYNLGMAFSDLGRLDEARQHLQAAVALQPDHSYALTALGVACQRAGDPAGAREWLERAIRVDRSNGYAYRNLGAVLGTLSRWDESASALRRACELLPGDQPSAFGLAEVLAKSGDSDLLGEADRAYERAISIDPTSQIAEMAREARSRIAQTNFRKTGGEVRPDALMYCLSALQKFGQMSDSEVQAVAFEIAMLGRRGIEVNDPSITYELRSLPGSFTGLQLMSLMYVGFKRIAPELDSGFDLRAEYEAALQMHQASAGS